MDFGFFLTRGGQEVTQFRIFLTRGRGFPADCEIRSGNLFMVSGLEVKTLQLSPEHLLVSEMFLLSFK